MSAARIICNGCYPRYAEQTHTVHAAWEGRPDDDEDVDETFLVCPPVWEANPFVSWRVDRCSDCGILVSVARSSEWLLKEN